MALEDGARIGSDLLFRAYFRDGDEPLDLSAHTVTGTANHEGDAVGSEFSVTLTPVNADGGIYDVFTAGTNITKDADLLYEFTFTGSPTVNAPAQPLRIPVRPSYGVA